MNTCLFVSDLHGKMSRYEALFKIIRKEKPDFVFLGGDLLPHRNIQNQSGAKDESNFVNDFLFRKFEKLKETMECAYPDIFLIPGNDDRKIVFDSVADGEKADLWRNIHNQCVVIGKYRFYGYGCVPPTPFMIKDWERFDCSPEINMGCIAPADGIFSAPPLHDPKKDTIENDIGKLIEDDDLQFGVFLFHSPPFQTVFDQALIRNGRFGDEVSVKNVGSKAILNFIMESQPYITMHGHIHESVGITAQWQQELGRTWACSAAHDGPELSVVKFNLNDPKSATRRLVKV
ncbi:MAG: metallophosphoesterase family protein [Bacteroidales bacterium]